jgi:hypothetical protein
MVGMKGTGPRATVTAIALLAALVGAGGAAVAEADTTPDLRLSIVAATAVEPDLYDVTWRAEIANAPGSEVEVWLHVGNDGPTTLSVKVGGVDLSCASKIPADRLCDLGELSPGTPVDVVQRVRLSPATWASLNGNLTGIQGEVDSTNNHTHVTVGTPPGPGGGGGGGGGRLHLGRSGA